MAHLLPLVLLTHSMTTLRMLRLLAYAIAVVPGSLCANLASVALQVPTIQKTGLPGEFSYAGCLQ